MSNYFSSQNVVNKRKQNKDNKSRAKVKGSFLFEYTSMVGEVRELEYKLGKKYEGTMLFFPSKLQHEVFPFYNCDEDRISISGNICIDETIEL